jgi:hypothetical protein
MLVQVECDLEFFLTFCDVAFSWIFVTTPKLWLEFSVNCVPVRRIANSAWDLKTVNTLYLTIISKVVYVRYGL